MSAIGFVLKAMVFLLPIIIIAVVIGAIFKVISALRGKR